VVKYLDDLVETISKDLTSFHLYDMISIIMARDTILTVEINSMTHPNLYPILEAHYDPIIHIY